MLSYSKRQKFFLEISAFPNKSTTKRGNTNVVDYKTKFFLTHAALLPLLNQ